MLILNLKKLVLRSNRVRFKKCKIQVFDAEAPAKSAADKNQESVYSEHCDLGSNSWMDHIHFTCKVLTAEIYREWSVSNFFTTTFWMNLEMLMHDCKLKIT